MVATQDYYSLLGVSRSSSPEDIKKAYKKNALKWHPDRCPNEADKERYSKRFAQLSKAYEVLSDPEKKKIYDTYGEEGLQGGMGSGGSSSAGPSFSSNFSQQEAEQLFANLFGSNGSFSFGGFTTPGGKRTQSQRQGTTTTGKKRQQQQQQGGFFFPGMGGQTFSSGMPFSNMGGSFPMDVDDQYEQQYAQQKYQQQQQQQQQNPKSEVVKRKLPCSLEELYAGFTKRLKITKHIQDPQTGEIRQEANVVTVDGKPGWKEGCKITFPGAGDELMGMKQDICFEIEQKPHPRFTRIGDDLQMNMKIHLTDALCGVHQSFSGIDGKLLNIHLDQVSPDYVHTIPGQGMPRKTGGRGNLLVKFSIDFPQKKLTQTQKEQLKRLFES